MGWGCYDYGAIKIIMATTASRDTTTGTTYEKQIEDLLENFTDYQFKTQVNVGLKRNGGKHFVDILLGSKTLLSLKFQRVQGTAEEKVPFEVMKLQHAVNDYDYDSAIIVLAGPDSAWKWKKYYLGKEFQLSMEQIYPDVRIISHEQFVEKFLSDELTLKELSYIID